MRTTTGKRGPAVLPIGVRQQSVYQRKTLLEKCRQRTASVPAVSFTRPVARMQASASRRRPTRPQTSQSVAPGHAAQPGQNMIFLAHALLGPFNRKTVIASEGLDPVVVIGGAPAQHLLAHRRDADDLAEEVHHLLGPRQAAEITMNDNAVEAAIDKDQQIAEQFGEQVHWPARHAPEKSISR